MVICNAAIKISLKIAFSFLLNYIFIFTFSLDIVFLLSLKSFTSCVRDVETSSILKYIFNLCILICTYLSV